MDNSLDSDRLRRQISARERRMTHMLCLICATTVLSNIPAVVLKFVDSEGTGNAASKAAVQLIYFGQFSVDFVVYAASNKQYREAYLLLLEDFGSCLFCASKSNLDAKKSKVTTTPRAKADTPP